jgi:hypothetical protein
MNRGSPLSNLHVTREYSDFVSYFGAESCCAKRFADVVSRTTLQKLVQDVRHDYCTQHAVETIT